MTTRTYTLVASTMGALAFALAAACGGSFDAGSRPQGVKPGSQCTGTGTATAEDGCNTCSCSEGFWACTEMACPAPDAGGPVPCTPGMSRPADDGCNTCVCSENGGWLCTLKGCLPPQCSEGDTTNDGCNSCSCSGGQWVCTNRACPPPPPPPPPPVCVEGETKPMDCNTCTCMGGRWGCTTMLCPPPACVDGQTTNDGCNSCSCFGGQWACTGRYCPPPPPPVDAGPGIDAGPAVDAGPPQKGCGGWLGNTCSADEYCAYREGQHCGAADASSFCAPRPVACNTIYAPVCGCDGKTYSNDCQAAGAGTGVMYNKECPPIAVP